MPFSELLLLDVHDVNDISVRLGSHFTRLTACQSDHCHSQKNIAIKVTVLIDYQIDSRDYDDILKWKLDSSVDVLLSVSYKREYFESIWKTQFQV